MQRLTKYSLLLNAIMKKSECPQEKDDLETMVSNELFKDSREYFAGKKLKCRISKKGWYIS
jgi:hypothetical protein